MYLLEEGKKCPEKVIVLINTEFDSAAALALLLGNPRWQVLGIVASAGKVSSRVSAENLLRLLGALKLPIAVYPGMEQSLCADLDPLRKQLEPLPRGWPSEEALRFDDGFLPNATPGMQSCMLQKKPAAIFLVEALESAAGQVSILSLGPLTDLACALKLAPGLEKKIGRLVILGGGHRYSDISCAAEANFRFDPEAGATVMGSPVDKLLVPLDCGYSCCLTRGRLGRLTARGGVRAQLFEALCIPLFPLYRALGGMGEKGGIPLKAVAAACAFANEAVLASPLPYSVDVDFGGGLADGQTVFDTRRIFEDYNCRTAFSLDCARMEETLEGLLSEGIRGQSGRGEERA